MAASAPTSIRKFYNENERPPLMGWHYFEKVGDRRTYFRLSSSTEVFERLKQIRINNGVFVSDIDLWRELWSYWCAEQPSRCGGTEPAPAPTRLVSREVSPAVFGPIIWQAMNLHAVRFEAIGQAGFLRFLSTVSLLMTCAECIGHWQQILTTRPPDHLATTLEACQWVNMVHNLVNSRRGAPLYPYERMVAEYGAPLP